MPSTRPLLVAAAGGLLLSVVACGGDGNETIIPEGAHHGYVVSKTYVVPPRGGSTTEYAIDLGTAKSAELDGRPDNQLGDALNTLATINMDLNAQPVIDTAVARGDIILLVDFQSKDFSNSNAGFGIRFGTNPTPAACNGATDTTCGRHLAGGAMFQLAANSPDDALLGGKLTNGTFDGGPGEILLQIAIGSTEPILVPLQHARAKVTSVSESSLTAFIGGLLTVADLKTHVGAALQTTVTAFIAENCSSLDSPPLCGCTGLAIVVMDRADGSDGTTPNCMITVDELLNTPGIADQLEPDACSKETCAESDALSFGIKIDAVAATFPM